MALRSSESACAAGMTAWSCCFGFLPEPFRVSHNVPAHGLANSLRAVKPVRLLMQTEPLQIAGKANAFMRLNLLRECRRMSVGQWPLLEDIMNIARRMHVCLALCGAAFAAAGLGPCSARAGDIIAEWASVKPPPVPELKAVSVEGKTTALLILDMMKGNC